MPPILRQKNTKSVLNNMIRNIAIKFTQDMIVILIMIQSVAKDIPLRFPEIIFLIFYASLSIVHILLQVKANKYQDIPIYLKSTTVFLFLTINDELFTTCLVSFQFYNSKRKDTLQLFIFLLAILHEAVIDYQKNSEKPLYTYVILGAQSIICTIILWHFNKDIVPELNFDKVPISSNDERLDNIPGFPSSSHKYGTLKPAKEDTEYKFPLWIKNQNCFILNQQLKLYSKNHFRRDSSYESLQMSDEQIFRLLNSIPLKCSSELRKLSYMIEKEEDQLDNLINLSDLLKAIIYKKYHNIIYTVYSFQGGDYNLKNQTLNFYLNTDNQFVAWFDEYEQQEQFQTQTLASFRITDGLSSKLVTNIFKSISHEFGTYLNCIMSLSEMLISRSDLSDELRESYIVPINQNSKLLDFILQNIRDFNQILLQQFNLKLEEFDTEQEINRICDLINMAASARGNKILIFQESTNPIIYSDLDRFRQVFYQLISNAIRFTENGIIQIIIEDSRLNEYEQLKIQVIDNGIGMTQEEQNILYDILTSGQKLVKVSQNSVGCGLGLNIANLIAIQLSGQINKGINFTTQPKIKTCFYFYLQNFNCNKVKSLTFKTNGGSMIKRFNSIYVGTLSNDIYYRGLSIISGKGRKLTMQREQFSPNSREQFSPSSKFSKGILQKNFDIETFKLCPDMQPEGLRLIDASEVMNTYTEIFQFPPDTSFKTISNVLQYDFRGKCCARVLLVDDEYFNILCLQQILKQYDPIVNYAFNGKQAIKLIEEKSQNPCRQCGNNSYVLYFLDINMPIMDGFETNLQIQSLIQQGRIKKGIIIANTGFVDLETKTRCEKDGFNLYLSKPVKIKELNEFLSKTFI